MKKRLKVELGMLGGCAVLVAGSTIAMQNKKADENPIADSSSIVEYSSTAEPESEVIVYTTSNTEATTTATTPETTSAATAATTPETTVSTTAEPKSNEKMVYVARSGEGTKYHRIPDCGNMSNPREITISEAEALGYEPCKKCY